MNIYQEKFRALLSQAAITQVQAAELIAAFTRRPCSPRAVRTWLASPDKPSARQCPQWAVDALEESLKVLKSTDTSAAKKP